LADILANSQRQAVKKMLDHKRSIVLIFLTHTRSGSDCCQLPFAVG